MIFNQPGDFAEIMCYNGEYYSNGTEVMVSDEYINTHTYNGKKIWKYAWFGNNTIHNGQRAYVFYRSKCSCVDFYKMNIDYSTQGDYAPFFVVYAYELASFIEKFTKPFKMSDEQKTAREQAILYMLEHPKRDWDYPELLLGWIIYTGVLIGSLMFKEFYIPWLIATYVFYEYRKGILSQ